MKDNRHEQIHLTKHKMYLDTRGMDIVFTFYYTLCTYSKHRFSDAKEYALFTHCLWSVTHLQLSSFFPAVDDSYPPCNVCDSYRHPPETGN